MFVELMDLFVEGLVPLSTMLHDRFTFHENTRQIIGERWGTIYSIGDRVRVIVDRVDLVAHKINFSLVEEIKEVTRGPAKKKARKKSERPEAVASRALKKQRRERSSSRKGAARKGKKRK
jgi:ribonuclease R